MVARWSWYEGLDAGWSASKTRAAIEQFIERLWKLGKRLIVLGESPSYGIEVANCPDTLPTLAAERSVCDPHRFLATFRMHNDVLQRVPMGLPGVLYYDLNALVCPMGVCRRYDENGRAMYSDDNHVHGAQMARMVMEREGVPGIFRRHSLVAPMRPAPLKA